VIRITFPNSIDNVRVIQGLSGGQLFIREI